MRLGDLPAPPVRLGVVHREPPVTPAPQAIGQPVQAHHEDQRVPYPAPQRTAARTLPDQRHRGRPGPRGLDLTCVVANADQIASPSSSVQSLGGVPSGRCCSTGPSVFPGYRAVGNRRDPGSVFCRPRMSCHGPCACAPGKRTWFSRAKRYGRALPSSRPGAAPASRVPSAGAPP